MDPIGGLLGGFAVILTAQNLYLCLIGSLIGTLVGVLPGVGPLAAPSWIQNALSVRSNTLRA